MAPPSSSSPSLPPPRCHLFTPIEEGNESEETTTDQDQERRRFSSSKTPTPKSTTTDISSSNSNNSNYKYHHQATPLHTAAGKPPMSSSTTGKPRRKEKDTTTADTKAISCNNCRPTTREKSSIVPVGDSKLSLSPNIFKSLISNISKKSPKLPEPSPDHNPSSSSSSEKWVSELSQKLLQANRKRDEAVLEASRLKYSMAELEKKLTRLESYCHNLKSSLEVCSNSNKQLLLPSPSPTRTRYDVVIKDFLVSVSDARTLVRSLSKSLTAQLKLMGAKVTERLCTALLAFDVKLSANSSNNNPRTLQVYLEALLSGVFYEDFETPGFGRGAGSVTKVLNPIDRAEANYSGFHSLKDLTWEEVLSKGTKHFSEEFSGYCDRKMSEIVAVLGWTRAWPEQLLQAFFGAAKSVWLVHLLANAVHPGLMVFRVDKGVRFDSVYMDEMCGDKAKKLLVPSVVRVMVAPGFYVGDNVVKCKVVCRYYNGSNHHFGVFGGGNGDDNRSILSSP